MEKNSTLKHNQNSKNSKARLVKAHGSILQKIKKSEFYIFQIKTIRNQMFLKEAISDFLISRK